MSHDELIKDLNACIKGAEYGPYEWGFTALLAIAELHKPSIPMDNETGDYSVLAYCNCSKAFNEQDVVLYPCPTIQAIEEQLK